MHSTVTNAATRQWLEKMRSRIGAPFAPPPCGATPDAFGTGFRELSFVEPHKRYQNSCSIFQKRPDGFAEPLHTSYP